MFGKKSREIAVLKEQLETAHQKLADIDVKAHPHFLLAQQIDADVQRMTSVESVDIETALQVSIDHARENTLHEALEARLANIPVMALLEAFDKRVGHEEVNKILAKRALAELKHQKKHQLLYDLHDEAAQSRRIDLARLPLGSIVTIGLFDERLVDKPSYDHRDSAGRTFVGRVEDEVSPHKLTIFEDIINKDLYKHTDEHNVSAHYSTLTQVEIGGMKYRHNGRSGIDKRRYYIDGCLAYNVRPAVRRGLYCNEFQKHVVGYVMVDGIVILDNPNDMQKQIEAEQ